MRSPFKNVFYRTFQEIFETSIAAQNPNTLKFKSILESLSTEKSTTAIIEILQLYDVYALDISTKPVPIWAFFEDSSSRSTAKEINKVTAPNSFISGDTLTHMVYKLSSDFGISPRRIGVITGLSNIPSGAEPPWVRKSGPLWNSLFVDLQKQPPIELYHESLRKMKELV